VIIGASTNPDRYAYRAALALQAKRHEAISVGLKEGEVNGIKILANMPEIKDVDTVTLYVGPRNQPYWYDYILGLHPKRVIFNPGTENPEFEEMLQKNNIQPVEACTLLMLSIGNY
jgi:predicted CoA-binding protein